jgi:putative endonuclease
MYYVYILQDELNSKFYIGHANNLDDRIKRHNEGRSGYTKRGQWKLYYSEEYKTRSEAMLREKEIKSKKSRKYIEKLKTV